MNTNIRGGSFGGCKALLASLLVDLLLVGKLNKQQLCHQNPSKSKTLSESCFETSRSGCGYTGQLCVTGINAILEKERLHLRNLS